MFIKIFTSSSYTAVYHVLSYYSKMTLLISCFKALGKSYEKQHVIIDKVLCNLQNETAQVT